MTQLELPKLEVPKLEVTPLELPKLEVPKLEVPKSLHGIKNPAISGWNSGKCGRIFVIQI